MTTPTPQPAARSTPALASPVLALVAALAACGPRFGPGRVVIYPSPARPARPAVAAAEPARAGDAPPRVVDVVTLAVPDDPPPAQACDPANVAQCPAPTIQCSAPASALAGAPVQLSAQATGSGVRVRWSVVQEPQRAAHRFASRYDVADQNAIVAEGPRVPFTSVIVGSYTVRAEAVDSLGRVAACDTTVTMSGHGLRVELAWDTNGTDVDLHAVTADRPRWFTEDDCYYANRTPDAAVAESGMRRWLDTDDVDGFGPENIRVDVPRQDTEYVVGVHFYSSHGQSNPSTPAVVVYCGERRAAEFARPLMGNRGGNAANDFWTVAAVRFDGQGDCTVRPINTVSSPRGMGAR